jgi:hypothetical protein
MFASSQVSMADSRSFQGAYKHAWQADFAFWWQALARGEHLCLQCKKQLVPLQIVRPDELAFATPFPNIYRTILNCPACGITGTCSITELLTAHPSVVRFAQAHPRWVIGPETVAEYAGHPVIRTCMRDLRSSAELTVMAHRQTLHVVATFPA